MPLTITPVSAGSLSLTSIAPFTTLGVIGAKHDFGAVGNGVANDTARLQEAAAAAYANSIPLFLEPGTFLTDTVDFKHITVLGAGIDRAILKGRPGTDVLHLDSSLTLNSEITGSIQNLTITVDDSVNAAAGFNSGAYARGGTVGNAGIAVDFKDGATSRGRLINFLLRDIKFNSTSMTASGQNGSVGFYNQFPWAQSKAENLDFRRLAYGWWDDTPTSNVTSIEISADHNQYQKLFWNGCGKAARFINQEFTDFHSLTFQSSPTALELKSVTSLNSSESAGCWFETVWVESASVNPWNVNGYDINGANIMISLSPKVTHAARCGEWTGFQVPDRSADSAPYTELDITGTLNKFNGVVTTGLGRVTDTGGNNTVVTRRCRGVLLAGPVVECGSGSCRVTNSANLAVATSTWTPLTFNTERWDPDGLHSTVSNTSRLTCRIPGKYQISGGAYFAAGAGTLRRTGIALNGGTFLDISSGPQQTGNGIAELSVSTAYDLAAGDYVELWAWQDSGGSLNVEKQGAYSPDFGMTRLT